ncbi:MAG: 3-phosphoshikimate 1-carboxyvinyltransferase [Candidatus Omnitrophica bacterium]|nr:3-phosphoshikimate 1-carboxyvinyltransferase [Candidatus Omnitrophota bacterium]
MRPFVVHPSSCLKGEISLLGDKSITHRALILGAVSSGKTIIKNFPANDDCLTTMRLLQELGAPIIQDSQLGSSHSLVVEIFGRGLQGLYKPRNPLFSYESGTTFRLLLGLLSGQSFPVSLTAGPSLSKRPMRRVTVPLRLMGAQIKARVRKKGKIEEEYPPVTIKGGNLHPISYNSPIASAQLKSAILLAGLYADGVTSVMERIRTRDHTERMLKLFKANIKVVENNVFIKGGKKLISPGEIFVPGDISSAAFFIVIACLLPGSMINIRNVSLNPLRTGILRTLKRMGADIKIIESQNSKCRNWEPVGDLTIKSSGLRGVSVRKEEIPSLIDELPILMVAASLAKGESIFEGVEELRVKETDRIRAMTSNLYKMGADILVIKKGKTEKLVFRGKEFLNGAAVNSFADHRTAMSMVAAGLVARGSTRIDDIECINKSFPDFIDILRAISC